MYYLLIYILYIYPTTALFRVRYLHYMCAFFNVYLTPSPLCETVLNVRLYILEINY